MNEIAATIFMEHTSPDGSVFGGWDPTLFRKSWRRLCTRAKADDLHFHDLRRNVGSALQAAHVYPGIIALLLGHKSKDVTDIYKTFESWRPDLRRAVELLQQAWTSTQPSPAESPTPDQDSPLPEKTDP